MIRVPPDAPASSVTSPSSLSNTLGLIDDIGRFPGSMKLLGEAGTPKELTAPGVEKSSISLLKIIPVRFPIRFDPKLEIKGMNVV